MLFNRINCNNIKNELLENVMSKKKLEYYKLYRHDRFSVMMLRWRVLKSKLAKP